MKPTNKCPGGEAIKIRDTHICEKFGFLRWF